MVDGEPILFEILDTCPKVVKDSSKIVEHESFNYNDQIFV